MLSAIWFILMVCGIVFSLFTKGGDATVSVITNGIEKAFSLCITLTPIMCFWSGIMGIAEKSGLTKLFSLLLTPLTNFLFGKKNEKAKEKIIMNMSANILGMGNAATPLGLDAMRELDRLNPHPEYATNAMCMFIVINTASIQLIPSSVIALRHQFGSLSPSSILVPTLITTLCAFTVGVLSAKICARFFP